MRFVVSLVEFVKHEEEVLDVSCALMRFVVLATNPMSVGIGGYGRDST